MDDMTERLFVYGSLGPGRPNEHVLAEIGGTWEAASVKGHLSERGWGAEMGYPGLVLDEAGPEVEGFIFSSDHLHAHWERLDAFEGSEYRRVTVRAHRPEAEPLDAQIYVLRDR